MESIHLILWFSLVTVLPLFSEALKQVFFPTLHNSLQVGFGMFMPMRLFAQMSPKNSPLLGHWTLLYLLFLIFLCFNTSNSYLMETFSDFGFHETTLFFSLPSTHFVTFHESAHFPSTKIMYALLWSILDTCVCNFYDDCSQISIFITNLFPKSPTYLILGFSISVSCNHNKFHIFESELNINLSYTHKKLCISIFLSSLMTLPLYLSINGSAFWSHIYFDITFSGLFL